MLQIDIIYMLYLAIILHTYGSLTEHSGNGP